MVKVFFVLLSVVMLVIFWWKFLFWLVSIGVCFQFGLFYGSLFDLEVYFWDGFLFFCQDFWKFMVFWFVVYLLFVQLDVFFQYGQLCLCLFDQGFGEVVIFYVDLFFMEFGGFCEDVCWGVWGDGQVGFYVVFFEDLWRSFVCFVGCYGCFVGLGILMIVGELLRGRCQLGFGWMLVVEFFWNVGLEVVDVYGYGFVVVYVEY